MRVTAWSNGSPSSSGAGYGLRVSPDDRDQHFSISWDYVIIDLGAHGTTVVRLSQSFWSRCTELRSAAVGRWLLERHLAPWPTGAPPRLELHHRDGNCFRLSEAREQIKF
jgi:hypothetical protein